MERKLPGRLFGQEFNESKLERIKSIIAETKPCIREHIALRVCREFNWYNRLGIEKTMGCKVSLLRLHRKGLIELPAPRIRSGNRKCYKIKNIPIEEKAVNLSAGKLTGLHLKMVTERTRSDLWNSLIARYHYLGYMPLVGHQMRYLIYWDEGVLGAFGFSSSAWKIEDRDSWIGWDAETRASNLYLIINNSRFLLLPWIQSKNLASKVLSLCARRLPQDYHRSYGYYPVLLETFVETDRFAGTCSKAANWIHLGQTKGRGKLDRYNEKKLPVKDIFVYPLVRNYRKTLRVAS